MHFHVRFDLKDMEINYLLIFTWPSANKKPKMNPTQADTMLHRLMKLKFVLIG